MNLNWIPYEEYDRLRKLWLERREKERIEVLRMMEEMQAEPWPLGGFGG